MPSVRPQNRDTLVATRATRPRSGSRRFGVINWSDDFFRRCALCRRWQPAQQFTVMPDNRPSRSHRCNACASQERRIGLYRAGKKIGLIILSASPNRMKRCSRCLKWKSPEAYYSNTQSVDGLKSGCKPCTPTPYNYDTHREATLQRKYGLGRYEYDQLSARQDHLCAICKRPETNNGVLKVDHCHNAGKVRGLLCHRCNAGLGHYLNNPSLLRAAAQYLEASTVEGEL